MQLNQTGQDANVLEFCANTRDVATMPLVGIQNCATTAPTNNERTVGHQKCTRVAGRVETTSESMPGRDGAQSLRARRIQGSQWYHVPPSLT